MINPEKVQIVKSSPPPPDLPIYGRVDPKDVSFFGRTNYETGLESKKFVFGIKRKDRRRHFYIVGKSGVGKSKLLEILIRQDIAYGQGLCLFDPYGDIISNILDFIPENRIDDVILIDPTDNSRPIAFNPFKDVSSEMKHQLVHELIEIMKKQFDGGWTPPMEHIFRFIILALLDYPQATVEGMILMLTDENFRQKAAASSLDEMVKRFWEVEFVDWSKKFDSNIIISLVNKLEQFIFNPLLHSIFKQEKNTFDFDKIINEKKIILINLAKGKLGEENSSFFGSLFLAKIRQAGILRMTNLKDNDRKDFYLYIDEFSGVATEGFLNMLTEADKYGFCLTLAHQYRSQLSPQIMAGVLGNVANMTIFRLGGDDAYFFEKEMTPVFKAKDMINLGAQEFYVKMVIDGEAYDPFSAETLNILPPPYPSSKRKIIDISRQNYGV
mgnify:FL=1